MIYFFFYPELDIFDKIYRLMYCDKEGLYFFVHLSKKVIPGIYC